jgi:hypothetical protein
VKINGIFRARLAAFGYSQVPGIDFYKSFAPVINDMIFRILLITKLVWIMKAAIIDIDTSFLHGNLDEQV